MEPCPAVSTGFNPLWFDSPTQLSFWMLVFGPNGIGTFQFHSGSTKRSTHVHELERGAFGKFYPIWFD